MRVKTTVDLSIRYEAILHREIIGLYLMRIRIPLVYENIPNRLECLEYS